MDNNNNMATKAFDEFDYDDEVHASIGAFGFYD